MPRVKVSGYVDADDYGADPDDATGLTAEGFEQLTQRFREPLPLVPTFTEEVIGEAAVTEPEIRARALDAAVKILGRLHDGPMTEQAVQRIIETAPRTADLYTTVARELEPYLRGDTALVDAEVIEGA